MAPTGWETIAGQHTVWGRVTGASTFRDQAVALAAELAVARGRAAAALGDDPWQDDDFGDRMSQQVQHLIGMLPAGETFSGPEAVLLVTVPMLHDALWSGLAAQERGVDPGDLEPSQDASSDRAAFERFTQTYAQPHRRALAAIRAGRRETAAELGWWLLHRWIGRRPQAYQPGTIAALTGSSEDARTAELLRAVRADPAFLNRHDRPESLLSQHGTVRERLVGFLLAIARGLAIEVTVLPEVIGEHLGIGDPVTPGQVLETVRGSQWQPRGATLVLTAACAHPSIEVALRAHIDTLNQLLAEAQRATSRDDVLLPLRHLPNRAATDDVGPLIRAGVPAYQSAGVRFRLAEDRVRELLMGEQLYGDPALAIRELYQNALDACRYREARTEYLSRAHDRKLPWDGRIKFVQGVDADGRGYLDCTDNGIGMGVRELSEVFSQAGVRLADLPEFLEEQAEWARLDPPVQLFPNSRFGIGVLSYFMLADELTVETCRMGRDGQAGERLRVSIAGPGSLFRIQDLGPGTETGTTVRLHLREGVTVSSVEELRKLLWVAEFGTDASDGVQSQAWAPGELSSAAEDLGDDEDDEERVGPGVVAAEGARVWWCRNNGALLADGLYAGKEIFGAVVNLNRDLAPRLSVDRTKILAYREDDVDRLLWEAVPALTAPGTTLLGYEWLCRLAPVRPLVADLIYEQAIERGHGKWEMDGETVDAAVTGCFVANDGPVGGPDELVEWRLTALAAGGRYRKVLKPGPDWRRALRARPSDALLLSVDVDGTGPWLDPVDIVPLVHLVRAARKTGRSAPEIAARLEALGFEPSVGAASVGVDPDDLIFTSRDVDGTRPWLQPDSPVHLVHLLRAAHRTGRSVHQVVARLRQLGFDVDVDVEVLPLEQFGPKDLTIASRDLDGSHPWLDPREPVTLLHLLRAAHKVGLPAEETAARLALLGYPLDAGWETLTTEPDDLILISRDLDSTSPWLDLSEEVAPVHVLRAAERSSRPVPEVVARLRSFGFTLGGNLDAIEVVKLEPEDLQLASRDLDGSQPWLDSSRPVPLIHLLRAAESTGREVGEVAARLSACGYRVDVDPDAILIDHLEPDDLTITSEDLDGSDPWLDPMKPVPTIRILRAAQRTRRSVHDIAARLTFLGYAVSLNGAGPSLDQVEPDDLLITSRDLDGSQPWLDLDEQVPLPHLLQAARRVRRPVHEIAARLEILGYTVDVDLSSIAVDSVKPNDLLLASTDLDGSRPWLDASQPVPLNHLLAAAQKIRKPIEEVSARLRALGYAVPDVDTRLPRLRPGGV
ncbi:HD domain-containing protein [Dactylosporangium sp. CS-033363]|uniref:wHTH domain-containing protein n=1 Tax=Dactylosporangium sp. CS-033363 TaxID=3239935 RepID=UPI003D9198FF